MRAHMYKSVVVDVAHTWAHEQRPRIPWEDTIIYEAHVKGLTQRAIRRCARDARQLSRAGRAAA